MTCVRDMSLRAMRTPRRPRGFTLLEMLVVVGVLAGTAMVGLALTADRGAQQRYEDTQRRLAAIMDAVRGPQGAVWNGQIRLAGFVADNGRLPASLRELSDRDALVGSTLAAFGPESPRFDPDPAPDGWNDGGEIPLDADGEKLPKGLRRYLESRYGSAEYPDAWGNEPTTGNDADNYGWSLSVSGDTLSVRSLGADNADGSDGSEYAGDVLRTLSADDWSLPIAGWTVTLTNVGADDIDCAAGIGCPAGGQLRASLLVYENASGAPRWRRLSSSGTTFIPAAGRAIVAFGGSDRIPQGEHLLVLVQDSDATPHNGGESPRTDASSARITQRLEFHAGAARPQAEFVLR